MTTLSKHLTAFLISGVCVAGASPAWAAGINMYWNDCSLGSTAASNRTFACDTNSGANTLYLSYDPPPGLNNVVSIEVTIDLQSASTPLPDWWRLQSTGCRPNAASLVLFPPSSCIDPWEGQNAAGGIAAYYAGFVLPNRARMLAVAAVPEASVMPPILPGNEYLAMAIRIANVRTTGLGACAGCSDPVCMILGLMKVFPTGSSNGIALTTPITSNIVSWQSAIPSPGCGVTPTLNRTWGQIKTIYR